MEEEEREFVCVCVCVCECRLSSRQIETRLLKQMSLLTCTNRTGTPSSSADSQARSTVFLALLMVHRYWAFRGCTMA